MAPPNRQRHLRKDTAVNYFKLAKPQVYAEQPVRPSSTLAPNIRSLSWSPTGGQIACCTSVNIRVWNAERPEVKFSSELKDGRTSHSAAVEKLAYSPSVEGMLASAGMDSTVKLWDVRMPAAAAGAFKPQGYSAKDAPKNTHLSSKTGECKLGDPVLFLTWHPSGNELLVGRRDDVVHVIDVRRLDSEIESSPGQYELTAEERMPVKDCGNFNQMSFSNSGREVFATTADGPVKILDYPSMQPVHALAAHTSSTYAAQHSPAGTCVAVGAGDGLVTLWDTTSWLCVRALRHHTAAARDLGFSFDGNYLTIGSGTDSVKDGDKGLRIYHVDTGDLVHTVDTTNVITYTAWHPFRYAVAYAGDPGGVKIVGTLAGT